MPYTQKKGILVLVSTDRSILEEKSEARARMKEYAALFYELHIIVYSQKKHNTFPRIVQIAENAAVYQTRSTSPLLYINDGKKLGLWLMNELARAGKMSEVVISSQDPFETGWLGNYLSKRHDRPHHVQIHTDFLNPYFSRSSLLNRARVFMAGRILHSAAAIRVVSRPIQESIIEKLHIPRTLISVLPMYTELTNRQGEAARDQINPALFQRFIFRIVTVCRLEQEKDLTTMLHVMKGVIQRKPGAGLIVVGDGSQLKELQRLAKKLNIQNSVVFVGKQNPFPYYKMADLYLCTSLYEGYGLSLVEAALSNLPIVSTPVGIVSDIFIDGISAAICEQKDRERFVEKISVLATDPELRKRFANRARQTILENSYKSRQEYLQKLRDHFLSCL